MRVYKGVEVWSTLVMKNGIWVNQPKDNGNRLPTPIAPAVRLTRRIHSMNAMAQERAEKENKSRRSNRIPSKQSRAKDILRRYSLRRRSANGQRIPSIVKPKPPKRFISGVKRIEWPPHILRLDRKLENERRSKERAEAKKERQIPKYEEIEHVSVKVNREAEIARKKLNLNDRQETLDNLKKRLAELESPWQSLQ